MKGHAELFLRIRVNGKTEFYKLLPLKPDPRVAVKAWRIFKSVKKKILFYDVAIDHRGWTTCTCPDCVYRDRECKHIRSMKSYGLLSKEKE